MNQEVIMIIAGGTWQVPLIKRAKAQGFTVVCSNLYPDSPGFLYADHGEVADVLDREKNLSIARRYSVRAVLTDQSDIAVPTAAYVASKLNLPTIGTKLAHLFTNKYAMRSFCAAHGILSPEFQLCTSPEEVREFQKSLGKKIIIKPTDSQSSRGVYVITDGAENTAELFRDAQSYSQDKKSVIAERYIEGTEFTVDGLMTKDGHRSLCISQKDHFSYNQSIASELFFTNSNPSFDYAQLRDANDRLVNLTGLPFGITHAEYKYEDGAFYLIEIAARGGGTKIASHIVPIMSGIDNYAYLMACALGEKEPPLTVLEQVPEGRSCVLKFLDLKPEKRPVRAILGLEEARSLPGVVDIGLDIKPGDFVKHAQDDRSRAGYYIAFADSAADLRALMDKVESSIEIVY